MKRSNSQKAIALYAVLCAVVAISFFPFIVMLSTSLKSLADIRENPFQLIPSTFHFENFVEVFSSSNWPQYFYNSAYITVFATSIALLTNAVAGFTFARLDFRGRDTLFRFSLVGMMIPLQVVMVPVFLQVKGIPFMGGNDLFGNGGFGLLNSRWGIIAPLLAGPFGVFLCRQFYLGFPKALDDAARIDGCSWPRIFFSIYLPLSKPVIATLAVLKATDSWNQYLWPLIITNSDSMRTVQLALAMFRSMSVIQWDLLMAATLMVCLPVLLLFLYLQRYYVQGIVNTGIKG